AENTCRGCASGACCSGDVCSNACVKGDACTVPTAAPTGACSSSADCGFGRVCVSSRRCILVQNGCTCFGELTGTCEDFSTRQLPIPACGTCTADYTACCPGTQCIGGQCKATCP